MSDDFEFQAPAPQDQKKPAIPEFFTEPVRNNFRSAQEGREIFEDRAFVRIIIPGDNRAIAVEEVNDEHKARWPRQYAAFKAGQEAPVEGTPLKDWPPVGRSRALELASLHILTVEQLAGVGDNILQNLGLGARELRKQAQVWLDAAKNGAGPIAKLVSDNAAKDAKIALLEGQIAELAATIDALRAQRTEHV